MKYRITLKTADESDVLDYFEHGGGRALLDEVRKIAKMEHGLKAEDIRYENLSKSCPNAERTFSLTIKEDLATEYGVPFVEIVPYFEAKDLVEVVVPSGSLRLFLKLSTKVYYNPAWEERKILGFRLPGIRREFRQISSVVVGTEIDEPALLTAWADAGFPLEWDPREPKEEK